MTEKKKPEAGARVRRAGRGLFTVMAHTLSAAEAEEALAKQRAAQKARAAARAVVADESDITVVSPQDVVELDGEDAGVTVLEEVMLARGEPVPDYGRHETQTRNDAALLENPDTTTVDGNLYLHADAAADNSDVGIPMAEPVTMLSEYTGPAPDPNDAGATMIQVGAGRFHHDVPWEQVVADDQRAKGAKNTKAPAKAAVPVVIPAVSSILEPTTPRGGIDMTARISTRRKLLIALAVAACGAAQVGAAYHTLDEGSMAVYRLVTGNK